ncbi:MAG: hypothetical protein LBD41_02755 [Clostridiales Family XIII bacterium]|jgi:hypothetical protein|nr:hypothetical protein [Clostridiales Family XIII bacterium]
MKFNGIISFFCKFVLSSFIAFLLLNLVTYFYSNIPVHSDNPTGATDYTWQKNKRYFRETEGHSFGVTDDEGFNNPKALYKGEIDVLIMGSSQYEGFVVMPEENLAVKLGQKLKNLPKKLSVYNIAISGHIFTRQVNNLERAIKYYQPKYIVLELSSFNMDPEEMRLASSGELSRLPSFSRGLIGTLQEIPFLRVFNSQIKAAMNDTENDIVAVNDSKKQGGVNLSDPAIKNGLDMLINRIVSITSENNIKPIIVYHPAVTLSKMGKLSFISDDATFSYFKNYFSKNNITVLDIRKKVLEAYKKTYTLPYGFWNSPVGQGHLNKYGHALTAKSLFAEIKKEENKK